MPRRGSCPTQETNQAAFARIDLGSIENACLHSQNESDMSKSEPNREMHAAPSLAFVMELAIELAPALDLGVTPAGFRRMVPITGGRFEGPKIRGDVLPGGADWQILRNDGVLHVEARYALRTSDGALIYVKNSGLRHGPPEIMERLIAGHPVDPRSYYFRTAPRFEVSAPQYDWLNRYIFIADAERHANSVIVRVWQVE